MLHSIRSCFRHLSHHQSMSLKSDCESDDHHDRMQYANCDPRRGMPILWLDQKKICERDTGPMRAYS